MDPRKNFLRRCRPILFWIFTDNVEAILIVEQAPTFQLCRTQTVLADSGPV